jgi:transcriptional regulator with XRE-family HTH domain
MASTIIVMENLSTWLLRKLEEKGWTQSELARRSGVGQVTISRIITGDRKMGTRVATKIAKALNVETSEVLERIGIIKPVPQTDETNLSEIGTAFTYLSQEERAIWKGMLLTYVAERRRESEYATPDKGESCDTSKPSS